MSTATIDTIELSNVGPIERLSLPLPEGGGLVVLKARNGRGKTKALEAVETVLTGRGKIDVRDGELRGEVSAFGIKLTVGRSTRRSGELLVDSLTSKFPISDLIDPGLKDPDAADARRIKALVNLANVLPSAELFYGLVGGREQFDKLIGTSALASEDLVIMAERIKRDLESKARAEENQAEHAEGRARGSREAAAGVDVKAECNSEKLQAALEAAIRTESEIKTQLETSRETQRKARVARDSLEDAEASYTGPTLADAQAAETAAKAKVDQTEAAVRAAEEALRKARGEFDSARQNYSHAITARKTAESHEAMVKQWREQIAASVPATPDQHDLEAFAYAVSVTRQAVEQGALVRKAQQHLLDAEKHAAEAATHSKRAEQLREAAKGTDDVLSQIVAQSGSQLRVEHGRLVTTTRRGKTLFHDLSSGERARIAVKIGIDAVGKRGVLTLSQEIFEGLDPHNRLDLAKRAQDQHVWLIAAEASDDEEITAEVIEAN